MTTTPIAKRDLVTTPIAERVDALEALVTSTDRLRIRVLVRHGHVSCGRIDAFGLLWDLMPDDAQVEAIRDLFERIITT